MTLPRTIVITGKHVGFIDALKGYAIMFVLINHSTPQYIKNLLLFDLWGGMAVPIFLLIQVFHYYKHGLENLPPVKWTKILRRLLTPFILAEFTIILFKLIIGTPLNQCIHEGITKWGFGPGEYYIWIYFQFVALLPLSAKLFAQISKQWAAVVTIILCMAGELLCSLYNLNEHTYKFLFLRYLFLIYLGYQWAVSNILLDKKTILLSIVSILAIIAFDYGNLNLQPFFYGSSWKCFHWISYFYTSSLLIFMLHFIHNRLNTRLRNIIQKVGRHSWEIFCLQMVVFYFLSPASFACISSPMLQGILYMICGISLPVVVTLTISNIKTRKQ